MIYTMAANNATPSGSAKSPTFTRQARDRF
jgi:hypothetical protein